MPPRTPRSQDGFTLLECIAATVILGTAIVAGFTLFELHEQTYAQEQGAWQALLFLEREMEYVRGTGFTDLATTSFTPVDENPDYEVRRVVVPRTADGREVTVEVRWTTPLGAQRTDRLVTLRTRAVNG